MPKTRVSFWQEKFAANRARDVRVRQSLTEAGWRVIEVWECQTRDRELLEILLTNYFDYSGSSTNGVNVRSSHKYTHANEKNRGN